MKRVLLAVVTAIVILLPSYANAKDLTGAYGGLPWCGIYLSHYFGIHDRKLWIAAEWRHEGAPSDGPCVGCVVVWPHHVGVIAGGPNDRGLWLVHSGNDGSAVRTRYRSLRGAIAFRHVDARGGLALGVGAGVSYHADLEVQQEAPRRRHKHLVPLTVRSREARILQKPSPAAEGAHFEFSFAFPFTETAEHAHKVIRHHRKTVAKR